MTASRIWGSWLALASLARYSSTRRRAVSWKRAGERSINPRSKPAVAMATAQPAPSSPRRLLTSTSTLSKKISAKPGRPSSCGMGRTVMPGVFRGTRMKVSPRWRSESGSVRNMPNNQSAHTARVDQVFWPLIMYLSPSSCAVERMAAMSEPAPGSDQPCAQTSRPSAMAGRKRAFCSSVPYSIKVGPSRKIPFWFTRSGARAR